MSVDLAKYALGVRTTPTHPAPPTWDNGPLPWLHRGTLWVLRKTLPLPCEVIALGLALTTWEGG